jgi:glycosyltransferase involved in cell wall biosynthesis
MVLELAATDRRCLLHVFATFDAGGPQVRTLEVMRVASAQWRHLIVAADGRTGASSLLTARHNAEVFAMPRASSTSAGVRRILAIARSKKADAILTYNWGAMDGVFAALFGRVPLVHHEEVVPVEERGTASVRRNLVRRVALPRATSLVVPSTTMRDRATRMWRVPEHKVRFIPNGIDTNVLPISVGRAANGPLRIGCVAHLRPEKNVQRLIRAFSMLNGLDAQLCIVGNGPMREECVRVARVHGVTSRAEFVGHADNTSNWYRQFDLFALPSDDEQMPLAILEAMAHGLPVVATDVGDVRRMLPSPQRAFVVPIGPETDSAMARALAELLRSEQLRQLLGKANREHAVNHHSLRECARSYEQAWNTACGLTHAKIANGAG